MSIPFLNLSFLLKLGGQQTAPVGYSKTVFLILALPGDNTEKTWVHWFFAKQKSNFQRHIARQ